MLQSTRYPRYASNRAVADQISPSRSYSGLYIDYLCGQVEINDYPQHARWKATHKESLAPILEFCDVCITAKGVYVKPGLQPPPGERKLYLLIEGEGEMKVPPLSRPKA